MNASPSVRRAALVILGFLGFGMLLLWGAAIADQWWPEYFTTAFHRLLSANLVGVLVGAGLALGIDRELAKEREARRNREAESERREAAVQALEALMKAVDHNEDLAHQAQELLAGRADDLDAVVYFSTDPEMLDDLLPRVLETTGDARLVRMAGNFRYQLRHLGRKLDVQAELFTRPEIASGKVAGPEAAVRVRSNRQAVIESIVDHCEEVVRGADELKGTIRLKMDELSTNREA